jgi:hypothetical protein
VFAEYLGEAAGEVVAFGAEGGQLGAQAGDWVLDGALCGLRPAGVRLAERAVGHWTSCAG